MGNRSLLTEQGPQPWHFCLFVCLFVYLFTQSSRQSQAVFLTAWHDLFIYFFFYYYYLNETVLTPLTNPYWWKGGRWAHFRPLPCFILAFSQPRWSSSTGKLSCNLQRLLLDSSPAWIQPESVSVSEEMRLKSTGKAAPALEWWSALTLAYWRRVAVGLLSSSPKPVCVSKVLEAQSDSSVTKPL